MRIPLTLAASALLLTAASAQQGAVVDLSLNTPNEAIPAQAPFAPRATTACDDFNRPNSTLLGADWAEMTGDVEILNNVADNIGTGNSWMLHTGVSATHVGAKVEVDIGTNPTGQNGNTAAILGYNPTTGEAVYVKVQCQTSLPGFSHVGFYHGINMGAYPGWGGFFTLPYQSPGGLMTVSIDASGDVVTMEIDEDYDGNPEISMTAAGLIASGLPALMGDQYGLGFWGTGVADDFEVNDGCTPPGPTLAVLGNCPGAVGVSIDNCTANSPVALVLGAAGSFVMPANRPCTGLVLGLDPLAVPNAPRYFVLTADPAGSISVPTLGVAPAAACGFAQLIAVDIASCESSNVASL